MSGLHDDNLENKAVLSCFFFLLFFVGFIFFFVLLHLHCCVNFVSVILVAIVLRLSGQSVRCEKEKERSVSQQITHSCKK